MIESLTWIANILGAERYSQHSLCLTNDPILMIMFVTGDLVTWASYFIMGALLMTFSNDIHLNPQAKWLYGTFIFLCGANHLCKVFVLFWGIYRLDVIITVMMAGVSAMTAIMTVSAFYEAKAQRAG